jgi:2-deoxy-D-gluconate 3-dehydrogenase
LPAHCFLFDFNMAALFDLTGQFALVTGSNRGIGQGMALGLAEAGADIIGVSATMPPDGGETGRQVRALGHQFYAYQADFSDRANADAFTKQVLTDFPRIDILVNNAGTIRRAPAAEHTDQDWDNVLAINLDAPFRIARAVGGQMLARGNGKIIFTASLLSFQGGINVPGYAASKGAIGSLVKALANEWAGRGVNVNGIVPGYIATDNTEALRQDADRSASILSRIPAGRWGEPADFEGPVVFLASPASSYVHGTLLTVDGGWMGR